MGINPIVDRRSAVRYGISSILPGILGTLDGKTLDLIFIDVSQHGFGVLMPNHYLSIGQRMLLCLEQGPRLVCVVRWSKQMNLGMSLSLREITRVGLALEDPMVDLLLLLAPSACVDC